MAHTLTATASGLKQGLVVTADTMQVPARKLVLELPSVGYEVRFSTADVRQMQHAQFAAFVTEFRRQFDEQFTTARRTWFADIRKMCRLAEDQVRLLGKQTADVSEAVREMRVIVERVNLDLRAKCDRCADALQQLGDTSYQAALAASYRAVKRRPSASAVRVLAEFELTKAIPPAVPNVAVPRFVTMPTPRLR